MKKWMNAVGAIGITLMGVSSAVATEGYGAAGCGLGSLIFGNEKGIVQVSAATTNSTSYSQIFGITSGTSNCEKRPKSFTKARLTEFVSANLDSLAKEIATGKGESLETLAELMAIPIHDRAQAYAALQADFSNIFPSKQVEAAEVIDRIAQSVSPWI